MWNYEKRLEYPVRITKPNAKIAQIIMSQYGGPDGEMGASLRYLSQRYSMPDRRVVGVLTDVVSIAYSDFSSSECPPSHKRFVKFRKKSACHQRFFRDI